MPLGSFRLNGLSKKASVAKVTASGGTTSDITVGGVTYRTHRFTTTGNNTFTVTAGGKVDILLVGGGSGAFTGYDGTTGYGAGAGGLLQRSYDVSVTPQSYTITVGAGGDPGAAGVSSTGLGYTATGGLSTYASQTYPTNATLQQWQSGRKNGSYNGSTFTANWAVGGGGAGAGGNGTTVDSTAAGSGGVGLADTNFTSAETYYGGGGGGGGSTPGTGGLGGGGRGASSALSQTAQNGTANTGGGGGGGRDTGATYGPKSGGSGIVIVRYVL